MPEHEFRPVPVVRGASQPGERSLGHEREADAAASSVADRAVPSPVAAGSARQGALDPDTKALFDERFGHDFSDVRVHADEAAAGVADRLGASAFTVGSHIYFGRGAYQPHSPHGRRLLAHELAHVVQQSPQPRHRGRMPHLSRVPSPRVQAKLVATGSAADFAATANGIIAVQHEVVVGPDGTVSLRNSGIQGPPTPEAQELVRVLRQLIGDARTTSIEFIHGLTSTRASDARVGGGSYPQSKIDLDDVAALGTQAGTGMVMGRTGGSLLAHELTEQYRKQVHGESFDPAHAAAIVSEEAAVGATRGPTRSRRINATTEERTIPYTYPDGRIVEVTFDVVSGNYQNVRRREVRGPTRPAP